MELKMRFTDKLKLQTGLYSAGNLIFGKELPNNDDGLGEILERINHHPSGDDGRRTEPLFEYLIDHHSLVVKPYFDFDLNAPKNLDDSQFKALCKHHLENCLKRLEQFLPSVEWAISSYNGWNFDKVLDNDVLERKISYHFIASNYYGTITEIKDIAKKAEIFDPHPYGKQQLWRLPKQHKYGYVERKKRKTLLPSDAISNKKARSPKLITYRNEMQRFIVQYVPHTNININSINMTLPDDELTLDTISIESLDLEEEKASDSEPEASLSTDSLLANLPYEWVDNRKKWRVATMWWKALPGDIGEWERWCKTCKRFSPDWTRQNNHDWNSVREYKGDAKNHLIAASLTSDIDIPLDQTLLFNIFSKPWNDIEIANDLYKKVGPLWKVVDSKTIYYFCSITNLWVLQHSGKESIIGCIQTHYYPLVRDLEDIVDFELIPSVPDNHTIKSIWFGESDYEAYKKRKALFSKNCLNLSSSTKQTGIIRQFFQIPELNEPRFVEGLNPDKHMLSVSNGKVNLRTGELTERTYADYIDYCLELDYTEGLCNNEFIAFINCILTEPNKPNCLGSYEFLQTWLGYCITGETREAQTLIFLGDGSNGKGALQGLLNSTLKSNHSKLINIWEPGFLLEKDSENNAATPNKHKLLGCRLGYINELPKDYTIGADFKRYIDGFGTQITSRQLYGTPQTFDLTTKFNLFGNSFPNFDVNSAFCRRILTLNLPNEYVDKVSKPIHKLKDRMLIENMTNTPQKRQGILNWLIIGAQHYYNNGLSPLPPHQSAKRDQYIDGNNWLNKFTIGEANGMVSSDTMAIYDVKADIQNYTGHMLKKKEIVSKLKEAGARFTKIKKFGKTVEIFRFIKGTVQVESEDDYDSD
tara:strand:- start:788 stop:3397 length:2610 start_codon:yes stop_codon:yes gene_type:complete